MIFLNTLFFFIRRICFKFVNSIRFSYFRAKWKSKNINNFTSPVKCFPLELIEIGDYSYGPIDVYYWNADLEKLVIGKYCSIARGVKFILGGNHSVDCLLSYPIKTKFLGFIDEATTKGPIIVEDDVWIGTDVIILSGITIGRGAIIAAGAVVTKSIPPYSIVGGNPARVLKMRFSQSIIDVLKNVDYSKLNSNFIIGNNILVTKKMDLKLAEDLMKIFGKSENVN